MDYVSKCILELNGVEETNFTEVTEMEQEIRDKVNLMNKTGFVKKTIRDGVKVTYVLPENGEPPFNWGGVTGAVFTIVREDGVRVVFTGVSCLKVGEVKYDAENAATQEIELGATMPKTYQ
tara:strand:+ start:1234 stop:1596 length:363 start_codon:yes stop_codon:yes gene_type:complete